MIRSVGVMPGSEEDEAVTVLVRSVMAFLHRAEILRVYAEETAAPAEKLKAWSFHPMEDGRPGIDLALFYRSPCRYEQNRNGGENG